MLEKIILKIFCGYAPWGLYYKTFYGRNLRIFVDSGLTRKH